MIKRKPIFSKKTSTNSFLVLVAIGVGLFLRVYHVGEFNNFFHDQGRDALVVKRIIVDKRLTLLGPQTTAPGVYLGPFYYYLSIVPLWLNGLNPVGMDYLVVFLGTGAIILIYLLSKEMFNKEIGALAAFLYGTSSLVIGFSNHAWNPNPLPFFMLLFVWGMYKLLKDKDDRYLYVTALGIGASLQLHLFSVILVPLFVFFWFFKKYKIKNIKIFLSSVFLCFLILSPWFLFELRHNFLNSRNLIKFLTSGRVGLEIGGFFERILKTVYFLGSFIVNNGWGITLIIALFLLAVFLKIKKLGVQIFAAWLFLGILTIGGYKGIYQSYHSLFLSPLPFLFFALLISIVWSNKYMKVLAIILTAFLVFLNIKNFNFEKDRQRKKIIDSVVAIIKSDLRENKNLDFNIAGVTGRFDHNAMDYRYFLEIKGERALGETNYQEADVLYVVNEGEKINLLESKIMEIRDFSPKKVAKIWEVGSGVKVYKLIK